MFELLEKGGAFVTVLAVLSFICMFFVLERIFFFQRVKINVGDLLLGLANHVRKGAFAEAIHEAARAPGPTARVAHAVLMRKNLPRRDLRDVAQEAGQLEVPRMERNLRVIYGIALMAPLVGMLGTISGLVTTFVEMSNGKGLASSSEMSRGVYEALLTSGLGLALAIPAYLFYLFFYGRVKRMAHRIERTGIEMVNIICDAREQSEVVFFREESEEVQKKKGKQKGKK